MTDNDIIKALECCSKPYCNHNGCPLHTNTINTKDCITQLSTNALDLINRQKAEAEKQEAEIERLYYILQCYALEYGTVGDKERLLKVARAEAVKEFAERLKANILHKSYPMKLSAVGEIDKLLKKFTEGKEDEDK